MPDPSENNQHEWEATLLDSFLGMVKAADGDFTAIYRLAAATGDSESFNLLIERLSQLPQGKTAFEQRCSLGNINLEQLRELPDQTLGHLYAEHMIHNQLKPLQSPPAESDHQFLSMHITETHDIWHVVTGTKTDILGEIQLEAFYVAQLEVSRFWLALLAKNLLKSVVYDIDNATHYMDALTQGWQMGKAAKPLFGLNWHQLWATPIDQVRQDLGIQL